jgi:hypothetical protein
MAAIWLNRGHLPRAAASYGWQVTLQLCEQHSELNPQDVPVDLQGWHTLPTQLPEQQVSRVAQDDPLSVQQPLTPLHSPL